MGKKKFIDKKKAATFQLLARDSSDPSFNESSSNDRVFVRVDNNPYAVEALLDGNNPEGYNNSDSVFADAPEDEEDVPAFGNSMRFEGVFSGSVGAAPLPENIRKEILELGFPDDGYNYLIHLREIRNTGGGSAFYHNPKFRLDELPRDVKAYDASRVRISELENKSSEKSIYTVASKTVGVKVQKAIDPEVVALLDDGDLSRFGSDVEDLEEDFIVQANLHEGGLDTEIDEKLNLDEDSNEKKEVIDDESVSFNNQVIGKKNLVVEEARDSTPRVPRPLDEQFDLLEHQEYGSDSDDYGGYGVEEESLAHKLGNVLNDHVKDLELDGEYKAPADLLHANEGLKNKEQLDTAADIIRRCSEYAKNYENEAEGEKVVFVEESSDESEQWDCETIVSTYSNLDNHPGKIEAPQTARKKKLAEIPSDGLQTTNRVISLRGKEQLPVDFLPNRRKAVTEKVKFVEGLKTEQPKRKPHGQESKQEKKERKKSLTEERRQARQAKKEMKGLYRGEAKHAQKVAAISGPSSIRLM